MRYKRLLFFILIPIFGHAEWMSDIDKKYQSKNPQLYEVVLNNKKMIDAGLAYSDNSIAQALQIFTRQHQKFVPAYIQLGRATMDINHLSGDHYTAQGLTQAEGYFNKALAMEPNYDYALVMLGFVKLMQSQLSAAADYYHQAQALHSKYPYLHVQLSVLARNKHDYPKLMDECKAGYAESLDDPSTTEIYLQCVLDAYHSIPAITADEVEKWTQRYIAFDPQSATAWRQDSFFQLYYQGDEDAAIKSGLKSFGLARPNSYARRDVSYFIAQSYYVKWARLKDVDPKAAQAAWQAAEGYAPLSADMAFQLGSYGHGHFDDIALTLLGKVDPQAAANAIKARTPIIPPMGKESHR